MVSLENLRNKGSVRTYLFITHLTAAVLDDLDEVLLDGLLQSARDLVRQRLRAT